MSGVSNGGEVPGMPKRLLMAKEFVAERLAEAQKLCEPILAVEDPETAAQLIADLREQGWRLPQEEK